jgi:BirA family biotin operon repressor/biotin-[acetyl-CoA-carboxylase] ligase
LHKDPIESLFTPANQIKLPSCHSTNQTAADLLAEKDPAEGVVIITRNQTAGKGQRGNTWESQAGKNLTCSIILKPTFLPITQQFELTVISSLAIVKTLDDLGLPNAHIKWPNDIYFGDAKIAGILIENIVRSNYLDYSILGIGLNVNQQQFKVDGATSTRIELDRELDLDIVLDRLLQRIAQYYGLLKSGNFQYLRTEYNQHLRWLKQNRTFRNTLTGTIVPGQVDGVNQLGQLILKSNGKEIIFNFKEVEWLY